MGIKALSDVEAAHGDRGQYFAVTSLVTDNGAILQAIHQQGAIVGSHNDVHIGPDIQSKPMGRPTLAPRSTRCRGGRHTTLELVAPVYRSILDSSFATEQDQGVKTAGEQGFGPFPHFTLSMTNPSQHYDILQLPISEWLASSASDADARARMEMIEDLKKSTMSWTSTTGWVA